MTVIQKATFMPKTSRELKRGTVCLKITLPVRKHFNCCPYEWFNASATGWLAREKSSSDLGDSVAVVESDAVFLPGNQFPLWVAAIFHSELGEKKTKMGKKDQKLLFFLYVVGWKCRQWSPSLQSSVSCVQMCDVSPRGPYWDQYFISDTDSGF